MVIYALLTLAALQAQAFTYAAADRISGDTFDSNGNTLTSGGITYNYDFEDRLLSTSAGVTITYDGDGNRVSENTTKYLVDDQTPTGSAPATYISTVTPIRSIESTQAVRRTRSRKERRAEPQKQPRTS